MDSAFDINPSAFGFNFNADSDIPKDNISEVIQTGSQPPETLTKQDQQYPFSNISSTFQNVLSETAPTPTRTISYPKELTEKYKGTAAYSPWMDPYADNEKIAAQNFSMWDAVSAGLGGMLDNATIAGKEYAKSWFRTGRAIFTLDASYLGPPSEADRARIAFEQKQVQLDNPIYYDPGSQNDIFSRQFVAEALQNTGFTLGTMGAFIAETSLLGGAGKLISSLPKLFKVGAAARSTELAKLGASALNPTTKEQALQEVVENIGKQVSGKDLFNTALTVAGKIPFVGHIADAAKVVRAGNTLGLTTTELAKLGAGGFKRAVSEWNFAASEAAIEAGGNYGEIYDELVRKHVEKTGKQPEGAELENIRNSAMTSSSQDYGINMAILGISNKIAFGNLFRKLPLDNKFVNMFKDESSRVFSMMGKDLGGKYMAKNYSRNFLGAIGHYGDITKQFGKAAFARQVGADFARGLGKFQIVEGIQENLQEGTNEMLKDYYSDLYDDNVASWSDSFKEAMESQSWFGDGAGFKTFLMGAMTGFFISPITGSVSAIAETIQNKRNPNHDDALKTTLKSLNDFYNDPSKVLNESIKSIKLQSQYNNQMLDSAAQGNKYEYFNNKDSALIELALQAKRTGTFNSFKTYLRNIGEYDSKEFQEATGIDAAEINESPSSYMNNLVGQLDRYSEIYDKYNRMFGNYLSMDVMSDDPHKKLKFSIAQSALRDAIQNVAFNESKSQESTIRAKSIVQKLSSIKSIGQSAASNFNTIIDFDKISEQVMILESEIKLLEETEDKTAVTKNLIKDKKKEIELLNNWGKNFFSPIVTADEGTSYQPLNFKRVKKDKKKELANILSQYYTIKNKQSNIAGPVMASDVMTVLEDINDYQKLDRDTRDYIDAVNILVDPENALKVIQKYSDARVAAYARHAHNAYTKLSEVSQIFKDYVDKNPDELKALLDISRSPATTLDSIDKVRDHLENLTKMEIEKRAEDQQKILEAIEKAKADALEQKKAFVDISGMTPEEANTYVTDRYGINDDGTMLERYYIDLEGEKQVSNTWPLESVGEYFEIPDFGNIIDEQFFYYVDEFAKIQEQVGYNKQAGIDGIVVSPIVVQEDLIYRTKEIRKLVGQKVLRNGLPGVIAVDDDKYVIQHDDGSTTILGPVEDIDSVSFEWVYDDAIGDYRLTEILEEGEDPLLSIDDFSDITLLSDNMSPASQNLMGLTGKSITVTMFGKSHQIELLNDKFIRIDGKQYTIEIDPNTGQVIQLQHSEDGDVIQFTAKRAAAKPKSIDSKYIGLVNNFLLIKKPAEDLDANDLDAIINGVLSTKQDDSSIIRPAGQAVNDQVEFQADNLFAGRNFTPTMADIMDRYLSDDTTVTLQEKQKLFDWSLNTIENLNNLDPTHPVVLSYIELLNNLVINPLHKSDGLTSSKKQPKKPARKKTKAPEPPTGSRPPGDPPSPPDPDSSSTPEGTEEYVRNQHQKKTDEKVRKIDEFFKSSTGPSSQFTGSSKREAKRSARMNKQSFNDSITQASENKNNPFMDPDIITDLSNCII